MQVNEMTGDLAAKGLRFGIVASRFNDFVVDRLLAKRPLRRWFRPAPKPATWMSFGCPARSKFPWR